MQLRRDQCDLYAGQVAALMERYGVLLTTPAPGEDLETYENADGAIAFELRGDLPSSRVDHPATIEVRETLVPAGGDSYVTQRYEYELLDPLGDHRRAFHMHDPDWFARELYVLVHEHCEHPVGRVECDHYAGPPVKDSFYGVVRLLKAWTDGAIGCASLDCLD